MWRRAIGSVVRIYIGYAILLFFVQRYLVFPHGCIGEQGGTPPAGSERIWLETRGGSAEAWFVPPSTNDSPFPVVIFAHGNGELIDTAEVLVRPARDLGIGVFLIEYPGYGRSSGSPSRTSIRNAYEAGYDWLIEEFNLPPSRIGFVGRSLGGAVVCDLTNTRPAGVLVLQSTFTSLSSFAPRFLLPPFLVRDRFDCVETLPDFDGSVLVFHGVEDDLIPFDHGEALASAARNAQFFPMQCSHNDCPDELLLFWQRVSSALSSATGQPPPNPR